MKLELQALSCGYGTKAVVSNISLTMGSGDLLCLLGPNGAGKTTLFKTILGLEKPLAGDIIIDGDNVNRWSRRQLALRVGYVPQAHAPPFPYRVIDVIAMGRAAHFGLFGSPSANDRNIAEQTLEVLSVSHLGDAIYTEISGGERQLVMIARALAQQADLLVMDEPTSSLDYGNQVRLLNHLRTLTTRHRLGIIMTTHNPNDALRYASTVAVIGLQGLFTVGHPHEIITQRLLEELYEVPVQMVSAESRSAGPITLCTPDM